MWHNTNIKNQSNHTLFYEDWYNKGIMYVRNIYDYRKKDFYNFNELTDLYDLNNADFLKYYTLIGNIGREMEKIYLRQKL